MNKEQESIIDVFSEERDRRNNEEKHLRMKLQVWHSYLIPLISPNILKAIKFYVLKV
jgi:hypothetical protein